MPSSSGRAIADNVNADFDEDGNMTGSRTGISVRRAGDRNEAEGTGGTSCVCIPDLIGAYILGFHIQART